MAPAFRPKSSMQVPSAAEYSKNARRILPHAPAATLRVRGLIVSCGGIVPVYGSAMPNGNYSTATNREGSWLLFALTFVMKWQAIRGCYS